MAQPSWDDLQYLLLAVEHRSLSAGARALGVDHATVSRRIRRLERTLRQPLLDRQRPGLALTAFGEATIAEAERMRDAATAVLRLADARPKLAGLVRLTTTGMFACAYFTPALAELRRRQPLIEIELIVEERNVSLARREADIALRLARPKDGELVARKVAILGYGLYAAASYLRRETAPAFIGFEDSPLDLPEVGWLNQCAEGHSIAFRSNYRMAQIEAVRAGLGIGVLPHYAAKGLARVPASLVTPPPKMSRELWLLVHRDLKDAPRFRAVIDYLVERLARDRELLEGSA
ncbi:MAG TPA: LysR family transcriptional regulator [Candidatus Cybelea sp.]|nr:LysR family transcriptional regulator [Candidatus Cybelea sp.]